jgi:hypothetical protein
MSILQEIYHAVKVVFETYLPSENDLISSEVKEILSDPDDKKSYLDAIDNMRNGSKRETITLHNGKKLTLVS